MAGKVAPSLATRFNAKPHARKIAALWAQVRRPLPDAATAPAGSGQVGLSKQVRKALIDVGIAASKWMNVRGSYFQIPKCRRQPSIGALRRLRQGTIGSTG